MDTEIKYHLQKRHPEDGLWHDFVPPSTDASAVESMVDFARRANRLFNHIHGSIGSYRVMKVTKEPNLAA